MTARTLLLGLALACTPTPYIRPLSLTSTVPLPPRTTNDSVISTVLERVALSGLPDWHPRRQIIIQNDSGVVSAFSLPQLDSVTFVVLTGAQIQQAANHDGHLNVLTVTRPTVNADTATASATSHWVWQQRPDRIGMMGSMSACGWRLRRLNGAWQIDSAFLCLIT